MTNDELGELMVLVADRMQRLEGAVDAMVRAITGTVPPDPQEAAEIAAGGRPCPACSRNGAPVSNCPLCRGTGLGPPRRGD